MPASNAVPRCSAFIWYHAGIEMKAQLLGWLAHVEKAFGVRGRLLVRQSRGKTTFMEIYEHVESPLLQRIESAAAANSCFATIERRCESFTEVDPNE